MNIEEFRNYCLSLPQVEEKRPFDEFTLCYYIAGKIFALADLENCTYSNLKCNPDRAVELREQYNAITPGWHMNKKHWNSVAFHSDVNDTLYKELIWHSYNCVILSLPKKSQHLYELL